jgi:UDP-N-acetylglucosamine 2-epimerase
MLTILSVIGTRPEAIKMAPVIKELEKYPDKIRSVVCATGQHREMLDQVLELFNISPHQSLNIMKSDQKLSQLSADLFSKLDPVVRQTKPDWILAQGDTTTVMITSLVAFYNGIRFGHVEAGLRTGNMVNPFPEEMNRRVVDSVSDFLFTPTKRNRQALLDEGISDEKILVTGNTVIDALLKVAKLPFDGSSGIVSAIPENEQIIMITAHRRESFGKPLREICLAIKKLAVRFARDGVHFVYLVHMNPNVCKPVEDILSGQKNVILTEPLDYLSTVNLMKRSRLIMTDSGGIQEEAPSLGVPVLVMRDTTERPEGIEAGVARLVGTQQLWNPKGSSAIPMR